MRPPSAQTRLLASAPVFFGTWGIAAWSLYQVSQQDGAWPLLLLSGGAVAAVMKADAQVKSYKDWKRDWDHMGGGAALLPRKVKLGQVLGLILALPLLSILLFAGQHGGAQAVLGVLLLFGAPVVAIAALVGLWRRVRRGRVKRAARVQPVSIAVRRPLLPVPSLSAAYQALPPYCQQLLKGQR
jgi:hypothetical protein